jgi:hypothetical protein
MLCVTSSFGTRSVTCLRPSMDACPVVTSHKSLIDSHIYPIQSATVQSTSSQRSPCSAALAKSSPFRT